MGTLQNKDTELKIASNTEDGSEDGVPLPPRSQQSEMTWSICRRVQNRHMADSHCQLKASALEIDSM